MDFSGLDLAFNTRSTHGNVNCNSHSFIHTVSIQESRISFRKAQGSIHTHMQTMHMQLSTTGLEKGLLTAAVTVDGSHIQRALREGQSVLKEWLQSLDSLISRGHLTPPS